MAGRRTHQETRGLRKDNRGAGREIRHAKENHAGMYTTRVVR